MHLRKMLVTSSLLVICLLLLASASFAWLSLSRVPEVTGIVTNIGSNGNLEIALLSDETYMDPTQIKAGVGDSSVVQDATHSNLRWGNVIDLSGESYGLNQISLYPARLQLMSGADDCYFVKTNMLMIPNYGLDGRMDEFNCDTVSATYSDSAFQYRTDHQSYGVRGIGTINQMIVQQNALANARSLVRSYASAAAGATSSAWSSNGEGLLDMIDRHYIKEDETFTDADVAILRDTATRMLGALSYVNSALRQTVIGYAATIEPDAEAFQTIRTAVENVTNPLSVFLKVSPVALPKTLVNAVTVIETDQQQMQQMIDACDMLSGDTFTWQQIYPILRQIIDPELVYLGDVLISRLNSSYIIDTDERLTLTDAAGTMAHMADFTGNYSVVFTSGNTKAVTVRSSSTKDPSLLVEMADLLDGREVAAGAGGSTSTKIEDLYGYAVDIALRCNADSSLLLQTAPELRVEDQTQSPSVQGEGSYMRFSSSQLSTNQIVRMMDALRVGFLDNQGTLLGVAKLNTSNYLESDGDVKAPLYFYEYSVSNDGTISMGKRMDDDCEIMYLPENTPVVLTVVVWLDGDHVDNSLAAVVTKNMTGALNLQFASSVKLNSADQTVSGE